MCHLYSLSLHLPYSIIFISPLFSHTAMMRALLLIASARARCHHIVQLRLSDAFSIATKKPHKFILTLVFVNIYQNEPVRLVLHILSYF